MRVPFSHVPDKPLRYVVQDSDFLSNDVHMEKHKPSPRPAFFLSLDVLVLTIYVFKRSLKSDIIYFLGL